MTRTDLNGDKVPEWERVRSLLRVQMGESSYRNWLEPLVFVSHEHGIVRLSLPTKFMRDWVVNHFGDQLTSLWQSVDSSVKAVEIVPAVARSSARTSAASTPLTPSDSDQVQAVPTDQNDDWVSTRAFNSTGSIPTNASLSFETFVVDKPNELAYAAARRVADLTSQGYNPLFLHGGVGLGKSHLMHAILSHIRKHKPQCKVIYLTAEQFTNQFVRALQSRDAFAFKERIRSVDVLMIDDLQFIGGKGSTQQEVFHTLNELLDHNRQAVFSADKPPSDLEGVEERLRSRLGVGIVADIQATTYELRLKILYSKAAARNAEVKPKIIEFLAHTITSNVRELEGALNRILAHSDLIGQEVTLENCHKVLHDLLRANDRPVTIDKIQKLTAEYYNIGLADMHSARRSRAIARPRQIAMWLSKQLTTRSLPEIGRKFGGRDHTTVLHAVRRVESLCADDPSIAHEVQFLRKTLEQG